MLVYAFFLKFLLRDFFIFDISYFGNNLEPKLVKQARELMRYDKQDFGSLRAESKRS